MIGLNLGYETPRWKTEQDLIWVAIKLVNIKAKFKNVPLTDSDLNRLYDILGEDRYINAGGSDILRESQA